LPLPQPISRQKESGGRGWIFSKKAISLLWTQARTGLLIQILSGQLTFIP
jgi:hypothetical protein